MKGVVMNDQLGLKDDESKGDVGERGGWGEGVRGVGERGGV